MGARQKLILIDTNVFVIDLRYKRDVHYSTNKKFLESIANSRTGFTTPVNLLELCGILSFNLNKRQLLEFWFYFQEKYKVSVLPDIGLESPFPSVQIRDVFDRIREKTALGDALMLAAARKHLPFISMLITWDKDHFADKFPGDVFTPEEFETSDAPTPPPLSIVK